MSGEEILSTEQENGSFLVETIVLPQGEAYGVAASPDGYTYVAMGSMIYKIDINTGKKWAYVGGGSLGEHEGLRKSVSLPQVLDVGVSEDNVLYYTVNGIHSVFRVVGECVERYAGRDQGYIDGPRLEARFSTPHRIDFLNREIFIPDCWNHCVRRISEDGMVTSIGKRVTELIAGPFSSCSISYPRGLCAGINNDIYVSTSGPHRVSRLDLTLETLQILAGSGRDFGDGKGSEAGFKFPFDVAVNPATGDIFVADDDNARIRKIDAQTFDVSTLVSGNPKNSDSRNGTLKVATAFEPTGICFSYDGDLIWSERRGRIRFIRSFAPPRSGPRDYLPGFSDYLFSGKYSDTLFAHPALGDVHLHSYILSLWKLIPSHLTSVLLSEQCSKIPSSAVKLFLEYLYALGPNNSIEPLDLAFLAHLAELVFANQPKNSLTRWSLRCLEAKVIRLSSDSELALFTRNFLQAFIGSNPRASRTLQIIAHAAQNSDSQIPIGERPAFSNVLSSDQIELLALATQSPPVDEMALEEHEQKSLQKSKAHSPSYDLQRRLKRVARLLGSDPALIPSNNQTLFAITISENSEFKMMVHEWVLAARWKYFSCLLDSGLSEIASKTVELPSDMPVSAVKLLIQYLYTGKVRSSALSSTQEVEAAEYLISNGRMFRISEWTNDEAEKPLPGFSNLVSFCHMTIDRKS